MSAADVNKPLHLTKLKMFKIKTNCGEAIASQVNSSAAIYLVVNWCCILQTNVYLELRNKPESAEFYNCNTVIKGVY
jgi:hypothetical protein